MSRLQIIVGSIRPGRAADLVLPWVVSRAEAHPAFDVEVLDLRDWPLPIFAEHMGSIGDIRNPTYSEPLVRRWNHKIQEGDAFLFVTPEYNHSVPGGLKNAIDSVFVSFGFRNKPAAVVGYSNGVGAGVRAVEHLAQIMVETDSHPIRSSVLIPFVQQAFVDREPVDPATEAALGVLLDDLAWWSSALERARAEGQLPPGTQRLRAAVAAMAGR
ncbi:MAG TPA: NAD(P)H-dependent oxidoreductase [Actinomycetota bacterium]|nr:NAD(P)H-dependent oxidoreductase [Actinomycetota bacterium]